MSTKQLLFPTFVCVVSNMTFSMDNNKNKIRKKKDTIRFKHEVDKIKLIDGHGVSTGYMIKNKATKNPNCYLSYSPEEKDIFLEAYKDYSENYMSPK